ncbi:MAG TPA: FtsK/SpoIIIE domain-containing protein [Arachnia sp.]|nr:FtsK/SpoIIIE domain-containing protein [Arachnia sp.]HMT84847.1 FtsK/SpoIIIE domain-containing protein [Arachnia sp.]
MDTSGKIDRLLADLRDQAAARAGRLSFWASAWPGMRAASARGADLRLARETEKAEKWWRRQVDEAKRGHSASREDILRRLSEVREELAPGGLSQPWNSPWWQNPAAEIGTCIRLGEIQLGNISTPVPFLVPLVGAPGLSLRAAPDVFTGVLHGIVLRALTAFTPPLVRVTTFDPQLRTDLGLFSSIRQLDRLSVPPVLTSTAELGEALDRLGRHTAEVEDMLSAEGRHTVTDQLGRPTRLSHPLHILVLADGSGMLPDSVAERLRQIIQVGGRRGVFVFASEDALSSLLGKGGQLPLATVRDRALELDTLPGTIGTLDRAAGSEIVLAVCASLCGRPREDSLPILPLRELVEEIDSPWLDPGDTGIETVFARAGRVDLTLRLRSADPPQPNAIVGGAVGQGKSNLLLTIIMGLSARYSPVDLEMVLLDLKDGVEFAPFGPDPQGRYWLPHVRVLGLEFDRAFALATLESVAEMIPQRAKLMRGSGAKDIATFRRLTGTPMPRVLVVIDEFQRLFEGGDDQLVDRAAQVLELLARTGRSSGIHLILASQTISGLRGLGARADAIFSQFHNRLSMKNTRSESQAILSTGNVAAAALTNRGEVIAHESMGEDPSLNTRGVCALADGDYVRQLQRDLWVRGSAGIPPVIFHASSYATKPALSRTESTALAVVAPGAPVAPTARARTVSLARGPDQGVVVIGAEQEVTGRVLVTMVADVCSQLPEHDVVVLDGLSPSEVEHPVVSALLRAVGTRPVQHRRRADLARALAEMQDSAGAARVVVCVGLDSMPELEEPDAMTFVAPVEGLRNLMRDAAVHSNVVLGWWQSRNRAEEQLGFGLPNARAVALCGVGTDDLRAIAGILARVPEGSPRFTWCDRATAASETLVPFDLPAELSEVLDG